MKTLKEKVVLALELYKDAYVESSIKATEEDVASHSSLKCGVGAYISNITELDNYANINFCGIDYSQYSNELKVNFPEGVEPFAVDLDKWIDTVISVIKINTTDHEYELNNFAKNVKPVKVTNKVIDKSIVKAEILDSLLSRNVSFNNNQNG